MSPPSSSSPPPPPLLSTQYIQASSQKFKGLSLSAHHSVDDSINVKSPLLPAIFTFNITTNCIPLSTNTHLNPKITAKSPMVYKYRSCYDSTDLVHFPIAKQTIDSMLRNTVLRHSDCNMLTNFISVFVQLSARDFLKRGLPGCVLLQRLTLRRLYRSAIKRLLMPWLMLEEEERVVLMWSSPCWAEGVMMGSRWRCGRVVRCVWRTMSILMGRRFCARSVGTCFTKNVLCDGSSEDTITVRCVDTTSLVAHTYIQRIKWHPT